MKTAYILVLSTLEYLSSVSDPFLQQSIDKLENNPQKDISHQHTYVFSVYINWHCQFPDRHRFHPNKFCVTMTLRPRTTLNYFKNHTLTPYVWPWMSKHQDIEVINQNIDYRIWTRSFVTREGRNCWQNSSDCETNCLTRGEQDCQQQYSRR